MSRRRAGGAAQKRRLDRSHTHRREILILTEGRLTEPDYIKHLFRKHRNQILVTIDDFHGTPLRLVEEAIKRRKQDERDQSRGRGRARDEYWCVFDHDEHPHLDEAFASAADNGICIAFSNPCIELWFLLHFEDQTGHIERRDAQGESERLLKCGKRLTPQALEALDGSFGDAKSRALQLDDWHDGNDSPPRSNPSSSVWALVERIADGV